MQAELEKLKAQLLQEWQQCINTVDEAEREIEDDPDDEDWPMISEAAQEAMLMLHRIAMAGGIELERPKWFDTWVKEIKDWEREKAGG